MPEPAEAKFNIEVTVDLNPLVAGLVTNKFVQEEIKNFIKDLEGLKAKYSDRLNLEIYRNITDPPSIIGPSAEDPEGED